MSSFSESDDESEDEDRDGEDDDSAKDGVACFLRGAFLTGAFFDVSSDEESEEPDDDSDDDARRRLRFLFRLRGAVGLAVGILQYRGCCKCNLHSYWWHGPNLRASVQQSAALPILQVTLGLRHASMATDFWASSHK